MSETKEKPYHDVQKDQRYRDWLLNAHKLRDAKTPREIERAIFDMQEHLCIWGPRAEDSSNTKSARLL